MTDALNDLSNVAGLSGTVATPSGTASLGVVDNFEGSGNPGWQHRPMLWYRPGATADDVHQMKWMRRAEYSGVNAASQQSVNVATLTSTHVGENARCHEWNTLNYLSNKAPATGTYIPENVAGYDQAIKEVVTGGASHTTGRCIEMIDNEVNPIFGSGTLELDQRVAGNNNTDNNNNRYAIHAVFSTQPFTGVSGTEVGHGIVGTVYTGTHLKNYLSFRLQGGTVGNYINFPNFVVTGNGDAQMRDAQTRNIVISSASSPAVGGKLQYKIDGVTYFNQYVDLNGRPVFEANSTTSMRLDPTTNSLQPVTDNSIKLGTSANRWSTVYAGTGTINTSDAQLKTGLQPFGDAVLDAIGEVQTGVYQWLDAVAAKGEGEARLHAGAIAQDVAAAFARHGIDPARHAFWCQDPVTEDVEEEGWIDDAPVMETYVATEEEVVFEGGKAVRRMVEREMQRQAIDLVPVFDESGAPIFDQPRPQPVQGDDDGETRFVAMEPVQRMAGRPRTERRLVKQVVSRPMRDATGEPLYRLGLRYDQLLVLMAAWSRRELQRLAERVALLEHA